MMPIASCIPFPFFAVCDDMLVTLVYATCWLYMHLYTLSYMSMHKSCLLVCHPYFNTMKLWTLDANLHLSLADTTFCLIFACFLVCLFAFCLFSFSLVRLLSYYACHVYHAYLLYASFVCTLHLFFPLLVYWFLVFVFVCTHMERGHMELGHDLPSASKKGTDASM